ncbi:hypothetical protein RUE5091_02890 [Ruegeria denitrificans]|uniref:YjiS-like domain-containing protein n=1 Tax=Ruegeria denitrificans TaxID=1715692 RepID=A0A0N7MA40_9RHOB|nr:DUF1127 domain-containing protein [Ruegeria denitrificans]CUK07084.1 hypothetical protein RUE5091_02890 [Ruegeria denitrificans]
MGYAQTVTTQKGLFFGLFSDYAEARVENYRRDIFAQSVRALEKLSDRQLEDIGIPRSEIKQRAYQSVYHNQPYAQKVH